MRCVKGVAGEGRCSIVQQEVTKLFSSRMVLESPTTEGESPVGEREWSSVLFPSNTVHVEFSVNLSRPRDKAKYFSVTDSELVPWGKGEKSPGRGVK